jgi:hypothetical protein
MPRNSPRPKPPPASATPVPSTPVPATPAGTPSARAEPAAGARILSRTDRPSSLLDTRIIYCGDCLDQLRKLPDACIDLIYIDPPFNSNRNYEVFLGELTEPRPSGSGTRVYFDDRHTSTQMYIETTCGRAAWSWPACSRRRTSL